MRANLHLRQSILQAEYRCMQRLVSIQLGRGDKILDAPLFRPPETVDMAQSQVAVGGSIDQDTEGDQIVDLAQVGLATGIIDANLYSALVIMTLLTTLCTPPLLRRIMRGFKAKDVLPDLAIPMREPGG